MASRTHLVCLCEGTKGASIDAVFINKLIKCLDLQRGNTDESKEAPRVKNNRAAADAAKMLAEFCKAGKPIDGMPPSLQWSCQNWRALVERMRRS